MREDERRGREEGKRVEEMRVVVVVEMIDMRTERGDREKLDGETE